MTKDASTEIVSPKRDGESSQARSPTGYAGIFRSRRYRKHDGTFLTQINAK